MPSLLQSPPQDPNLDPAAEPTVQPITPTPTSVTNPNAPYDPTKIETVEERVAKISSKGGLLQQVGETKALQGMGSRGLLNTSMTSGAVQKANVESALPIASQDIGYLQRLGEVDANTEAQSRLLREKAIVDKEIVGAQGEQQLRLADRQGEIDTALTYVRGDVESTLIGRRGDIEKELQSADSVNRSRLLQEQGVLDKELTRIRGQEESKLMAQKGKIDLQLQTAEGAIRMGLLDAQGGIDERLSVIRGAIEGDLLTRKGEIDLQLQTADGDQKVRLLREQAEVEYALVTQRGEEASRLQTELGEINLQLETARGDIEAGLLERRAEIATTMQELIGAQSLVELGMRGDQAYELTQLEGNFRLLMSTNSDASALYSNISSSIAQILSDPDIPEDARQGLVDNQMTLLHSGLTLMSGISGIPFVGLLNFGGSGGGYAGGSSSRSGLDMSDALGISNPNAPSYGQTDQYGGNYNGDPYGGILGDPNDPYNLLNPRPDYGTQPQPPTAGVGLNLGNIGANPWGVPYIGAPVDGMGGYVIPPVIPPVGPQPGDHTIQPIIPDPPPPI